MKTRARKIRPKSEVLNRGAYKRLKVLGAEYPEQPGVDYQRPKTRGECASLRGRNTEGILNPCPFVSCRHNLYLDVLDTGNIRYNFPDLEPDQMPFSCALDEATLASRCENEELPLAIVAERVNMTTVNVHNVLTRALYLVLRHTVERARGD